MNDRRVRAFMLWVQTAYACPDHPKAPLEIYKTHQGGEWILGCTALAPERSLVGGYYREGFSEEKKCFYHVHVELEPDRNHAKKQ